VAERVILDTGVLIAAERGWLDLATLIGDDDPAIAAITAMQLLIGVHRSASDHRDLRALHVEALLAVLPVEDYTVEVARTHALLAAHTIRNRKSRGSFDLMIAATAAARGRVMLTTDPATGLADLPGVTVRIITAN
jgi:tRNA(fMet)-specific endonuclease VapC